MINEAKLPYTITKSVTATREGLEVCADVALHFGLLDRSDTEWVIPWPEVAERLRYKDGEPWCGIVSGHYGNFAADSYVGYCEIGAGPLHRLAAILCDTAEQFRILHWCVTELQEQPND